MRKARLTFRPSQLRFGKVAVGHANTLVATITNTGKASTTISQVSATGTGFSVSGLNLPLVLSGGQSITFSASFAPEARGVTRGSISVMSNAVDPNVAMTLIGTGTDADELTVTPPAIDFGDVATGSSATRNGTLAATDTDVTVFSASVSNSEFALSGLSLPVTIPAGQKAAFTVVFSPLTSGVAVGMISFMSDAANSPTVQSVTGTGVIGQHSVDLSWNASTSQDVVGYNVYRSYTSGGPYGKINSALDPSTAYTDSSVVSGKTYYYVATAVNSSDQESIYSNEAQAIIP
jgi:hypothetical protein